MGNRGQHLRGAMGAVPKRTLRAAKENSTFDLFSGCTVSARWALKQKIGLLLMAVPVMTWGQTASPQTPDPTYPGVKSSTSLNVQFPQSTVVEPHGLCCTNSSPQVGDSSSSSDDSDGDNLRTDLDSCHIHEVKSLPGSHQFASNFIEAIASDPDPGAKDPDVIWGLTADLSSEVPSQDRAMYISKSINGGATWTQVARVDSRYFDARIGEGLRNGFAVSPGGTYFVITTQKGAFEVFPQPSNSETL